MAGQPSPKLRAMLSKSVIACLAASAFATGALMPTGASAVRGGPMQGTWNWPPYAGSGGGMPRETICSYVRVEKLWGGRRRSWHLHRPYELMEIAPWPKSMISAEA
jgi:hypothetical protein